MSDFGRVTWGVAQSGASDLDFFFYSYGAHQDLHSFPTRRSSDLSNARAAAAGLDPRVALLWKQQMEGQPVIRVAAGPQPSSVSLSDGTADRQPHPQAIALGREERSEEHTSELQSPDHLVCRLLLE